jgi:hypothetical protein
MYARICRRFAFVVLLAVAAAAPAQTPDCSLRKVPADAVFYSSSLRLGEQMDAFHKSKALAKLMALPAIKFAMQHGHEEASKPGNPAGQIMAFFHAPENQELAAVMHDLFRNEIFMYGGEDNVKLLSLVGSLSFGSRIDRMVKQMQGDNSPEAQLKGVLDGLKDSLENIVAPDFVLGFRTTKPDSVKNLMPRLETALNKAMEKAPKELQSKLKREKIGDADAIVFPFDGTMVPWEKTKIDQLEDEKDEYKPLVDKLKALKITVTLALKGDYVLLCMGTNSSAVAKFGQGTALATMPEFAPLAKFADKRIASINYSSKKLAELTGTSTKDLAEMVKNAKEGLKQAPLSDDLRDKIIKDLETLMKEVEITLPKPYATMGFSFLNGTGVEAYGYRFDSAAAVKPLTITDNMGGTPFLAAAGRGEDATPSYKSFVKWLKIFYGHAEAAAAELAPEQIVDQMKAGLQQVLPYLQRFDEITGGQFLPALADGQSALVLDGQWKSKKWFPDLDQGGNELPMMEMGLLFGVSDAAKLVEAFAGYRKLINDIMDVARGFGVEIPEDGIPAPKSQAAGSATAYFWPMPPMGQDEAIQPTVAISKSLMTITMSMQHSTRLHSNKPLAGDWKALANGNAVQEVAWVDFTGLMKLARPWVEKLGVPAMQMEAKDSAPEGMRKDDIPGLVSTLLDVVGCLKNSATVTYRDGNNTVTHSVTVVEDIK